MYEEVNAKIKVAGVYENNLFWPRKFVWNGKLYEIEQITLTSELRDAGVKKRLYSVLSKGTVYRLLFNRDNETWFLRALWLD
ncbi:MAG: hypothetical protein AAB443_00735 [Patescibacteria group bacterium]